ncbi:MAG: hypothetical protein U1A78_24960 [Polyangia bacterium]
MLKKVGTLTLYVLSSVACQSQPEYVDAQQAAPVLAAANAQQAAALEDARKRLLEMYSPAEVDMLLAKEKEKLAAQQAEATRSPPDLTRATIYDGPFTPPEIKQQCWQGSFTIDGTVYNKECRPDLELRDGGFNMAYGFYCGLGWGPESNYRSALSYDRIDECCHMHDGNCWTQPGDNEVSKMLRNAVHFIKCVEQTEPKSREEAMAKFYILNSGIRIGAEIAEPFAWLFGRGYLYPAAECPRVDKLVSDIW